MADDLGHRATRHAVVIGGSLAGLLTARVLAEHAEKVTVVERDRLPEGRRRGRVSRRGGICTC